MQNVMGLLLALALTVLPAAARDLEFYFIDVEGGQATLIVTPAGQSMLVDAGWPSKWGAGADRIVAAAKAAGIKQIDVMLMTHYHLDHVGGIPELAAKIPIVTYIDHGPNTETDAMAKKLSSAYEQVAAKGKHVVVKPWDKIPLDGVNITVVAAGGQTIAGGPAKGAKPNPACEAVKPMEADPTENARSVGFVLSYGKFRFTDFGDLTWNTENTLVCPYNAIGQVDLYLITHHGMDISNSPAVFAALRPRVAIMNNGAKKGGAPKAFDIVKTSPGLEDLWQLHTAVEASGRNAPDQFIANTEPTGCQGHWIKTVAKPDGSFTITNTRNNLTKTYAPKPAR